jgi:hypothetical protein
MHRHVGISSSALFVALFACAAPARALTIDDTFSSAITTASNAQQIESTIESASNAIASLYSNPLTVTINFQLTNSGLGGSSQYLYGVSYAAYRQALINDSAANPSNTTLASAVANLSKGNDTGGQTPIALTSSLVDALGLGNVSAGGTVYLNSSLMYFGTGPLPSNLYSGTGVIQHEIDEILGGGGAGSSLGAPYQGAYYGPLDLYRYSAPGTPSYTSSNKAVAYFSINGGATFLADFNQTGVGDYGDFYDTTLIQNYAAFPGHTPEAFAGSLESTMLQSIGYDLLGGPTSSSGVASSLSNSGSASDPATAPTPGVGVASLGFLAIAGAAARLLESRRWRRERCALASDRIRVSF